MIINSPLHINSTQKLQYPDYFSATVTKLMLHYLVTSTSVDSTINSIPTLLQYLSPNNYCIYQYLNPPNCSIFQYLNPHSYCKRQYNAPYGRSNPTSVWGPSQATIFKGLFPRNRCLPYKEILKATQTLLRWAALHNGGV